MDAANLDISQKPGHSLVTCYSPKAIFILSLGNLFEQYAEEQIVMLLCDSDNFCCL